MPKLRLPQLPGAEAARETPPLERRRWEWSAIQTDEYAHKHPFQFVAVEAMVTAPITTVAVGAVSGWWVPAVAAGAALGSIFLVFLGMRAVYWLRAQGRQLAVVRTEFAENVEDTEQAMGRLAARIAQLENPALTKLAPPPRPTFGEIRPRITGYIEDARTFYRELRNDKDKPERVGELFDEIRGWTERVEHDLETWHSAVASDFRRGGSILSPQLHRITPTDVAALLEIVRRRGTVLRNVLEGTPGKDLEDDSGDIPF